MLEIVLLILKTAGIILVSILGILIVAVCLVLFVPARYRGDFSVSDAEDSGKKAVRAAFRATWLLHFVRVYISYEETVRVRAKLLFFTLMDTAKEKKEKERKRGKEAEAEKDSGGETAGEAEEESDGEEAEEKISDKETYRNETADGEMPDGAAEGRSDTEAGEVSGDGKDKGRRETQKQDSGIHRNKKKSEKKKKSIRTLISNILQTIRDFCDKLKGIKEKAEKIEQLWLSDHMVNSRSLAGKLLLYLLKHTKPKKLEGYIRFGFEDPSITGYAMAVYGILCPVWSPKLSVEPDFENQVLECHILIKGKIRVCHFVRAALRMFLSKDVRRVIKDIKKL